MNIGYTDNDLLEKEWINKVRFFQVLEWPSQSPDLNLIKHMTVLKKHVCARKLTHLGELHRFCQERWLKIKPEDYQQLVDGYQKHLILVHHRKVRAVEIIGIEECHDVHFLYVNF